ncbi:MAG: single-stranded DNA-binding protein [Treponema bryantii]|nr:single-stranded DNA-binding protein [Treponema bryantii]
MTDLNHVDVIGRCVKQPDLVKKGPSGVSVLTFTLAVNRDFFKKDTEEWVEEVSFIDFTIFGKTAENNHKWLTKGKLVSVEGYLKQERWKDKDGKTLSRLKIVPEKINPFVERMPKDTNIEQQTEEYHGEEPTLPQYDNYPDVF